MRSLSAAERVDNSSSILVCHLQSGAIVSNRHDNTVSTMNGLSVSTS